MATQPGLKAKAKAGARNVSAKTKQRLSLAGQLRQARISLERFVNPQILDKQLKEDTFIPKRVLQKAKGLVFLTVIQGGFIVALNGGTGCIIVRKADGGWTGPSSIGVGGLSFGALAGASKIDYILILPNDSAVEQFCGREQVRLGGEIQIALGPLGRDGSASVGAGDKGTPSIVYSYSHAQGLYGGLALDGKYITVRDECNQDYYKSRIKCTEILEGKIEAPANDDYRKIIKLLDDYCREERIFQDENKNDNDSINADVSPREERVIMSGFLDKESRHLKKWRQRWVILSSYGILYTFKARENSFNTGKATEALRLDNFLPAKVHDVDCFSLTYRSNETTTISFKAESKDARNKWIDQINVCFVILFLFFFLPIILLRDNAFDFEYNLYIILHAKIKRM